MVLAAARLFDFLLSRGQTALVVHSLAIAVGALF
jgi:hypothetical protein